VAAGVLCTGDKRGNDTSVFLPFFCFIQCFIRGFKKLFSVFTWDPCFKIDNTYAAGDSNFGEFGKPEFPDFSA
jgi:hypothetical protein